MTAIGGWIRLAEQACGVRVVVDSGGRKVNGLSCDVRVVDFAGREEIGLSLSRLVDDSAWRRSVTMKSSRAPVFPTSLPCRAPQGEVVARSTGGVGRAPSHLH